MEKTKKPLAVMLPFAEKEVNTRINNINEALAKLQDVLRTNEKSAGAADILKYLADGADWERCQRVEECRRYIARNEMPDYLVADALKRAADSVPQNFIDTVADICLSLEGLTAKDIVELEDGTVVLSQGFVDAMHEKARYIYPPEREAQLPRVKALVAEIKALRTEGVDIHRLINAYTSDRPSTEALELTFPMFFIKRPE